MRFIRVHTALPSSPANPRLTAPSCRVRPTLNNDDTLPTARGACLNLTSARRSAEDDPQTNPLGARGIGEIGIAGVAAPLADAVYDAIGVRVRDLPITLDKLA